MKKIGFIILFLFILTSSHFIVVNAEESSISDQEILDRIRDYKKPSARISNQKISLDQINDREIILELNDGKTIDFNKLDITNKRDLYKSDLIVVRVPDSINFGEKLDELRNHENVHIAEPNYINTLKYTPADTDYNLQWYLNNINMPSAWDITKGSNDVVVAVLDTGISTTHPDLQGKILPGYDAVNNDYDPIDDNGHGTAVSGVIAANHNTIGIAGLVPNVRILPIKVGTADGNVNSDAVYNGIKYAMEQGADVINMSFSGYASSSYLHNVIREAHQKGILLVAAAGNDGTNKAAFPASYIEVISVSATTENDGFSSFSNYGSYIDVGAPGQNIYTTTYDGSYGYMNGTSLSSPMVSGLTALLKAKNPNWTPEEIEYAIEKGAIPKKGMRRDNDFGYGIIDAYKSLTTSIPDRNNDVPSTRTNAQKIKHGDKINEKLQLPLDVDAYQYTINDSVEVSINISDVDQHIDMVGLLYNQSSGEYTVIDSGGVGKNESYTYSGGDPGTYYLFLYDYYGNWSGLPYLLELSIEQQVNPWEGVTSNYFKVTADNLVVYDNRGGSLKPIGNLEKNQVYPRVSDYGNWHRIQYGNIYGYVKKSATIPENGNSLRNENKSYTNQSRGFTAVKDVVVYDNTSGSLVPFGVINKGQAYPIVSDYGNWWRIIYADRVGYVSKSGVRTNFMGGEDYFKVLTSNLPVYDNRTGKLIKVGTLTKGQSYEIVSDYGNWHRINFNNYYGYVKKSETETSNGNSINNKNTAYKHSKKSFTTLEEVPVYDNTSGKLIQFGTIGKGKSYYVASDYGNWWRIIYADRVGYVSKSSVRTNFIGGENYFRVLISNLPIYDNRTGKLVKIGTLTKGQAYEIVSDYGNWHRIQYNNHYGYVLKSNTEPSNGAYIRNKNTSYNHSNRSFTALQNAIVYDNTSGKLRAFGTIDKNQTYYIASDYGNWWRIIFADRVGYVNKNGVKAK